MPYSALTDLLNRAIEARRPLMDETHETAFRLFNGFLEGAPEIAIDVYATTAVIHDYAETRTSGAANLDTAVAVLRGALPWLRCGLVKVRAGETPQARRGEVHFGGNPDTRVREHGVLYALDLAMNRDASFYLDTRALRRWAQDHLAGKSVLNTFAYTGSLGVAALAGGAAHVAQLDLNRRFLELARTSCSLNGYATARHEIIAGDFFPRISLLKRAGRTFDCVFLDPPFFATSSRGTVDLENSLGRLINKVRPLVNHEGWLVVVNNALYVSGAAFVAELEALCAGGYLAIESIIPVPEDSAGFPHTRVGSPPADPAPFNHATKIAVLRVTRKLARPETQAGGTTEEH